MNSSFHLPGETTRERSVHRFFISALKRVYRRLQQAQHEGSMPWFVRDLRTKTTKPGLFVDIPVADVAWRLFRSAGRVYFIENDRDHVVHRGGHYHPSGATKEIMIALKGVCCVELHSRYKCEMVTLDSPLLALVINNNTWHRVAMDPSAILLVIASEPHKEGEPIEELPCRPSSINSCTASLD